MLRTAFKKNLDLLLVALFLLSIQPVKAQVALDENPMVMLMKANVLFDQARFDEAVRMYNRILGQDENYAPALLMRARAKYELGAYKGVKMDSEKYVALQGVTKTLIKLMAKTELKLNNHQAGLNYVTTALELDPYDGEMYFVNGEILLVIGSKNDACESFHSALQLDYDQAAAKINDFCMGYVPKKKEVTIVKKEVPEEITAEAAASDSSMAVVDSTGGMLSDIIKITEKEDDVEDVNTPVENHDDTISAAPEGQEAVKEEAPLNMTANQPIKIDEDLTIIVTYGLGDRPVIDHPDILMLSNESGRVVIDVCVNQNGKVVTTAFNAEESTLIRSSLTSLAMRKAREFNFIPNERERQCGRFIFNIGN